ncbi:MAG: hypothetical protein M1378_08470 [Bacteroidetes bacterium]|jgi:hypothetical protein|nr:hypothetical protein [Bacteroidota bacterium]MCL5034093.1 hypothetical protein [Bacteroidota bacterium]
MKFFLKKCLKWLLFLLFTFLFFSLPVYLQKEEKNRDFRQTQLSPESVPQQSPSSFYFEFAPGSPKEKVSGNLTAIRMSTITDSSVKYVFLYVNGEKLDMAVISDTARVEFKRVHLKAGVNEIAVVLQDRNGVVLAVRKATIFSAKKT